MKQRSIYADPTDQLHFMRYLVGKSGLKTNDFAMTYDEIAEVISNEEGIPISKQAIEQMEKRALLKIRETIKRTMFAKYYDYAIGA